jgi:hypothetical protein
MRLQEWRAKETKQALTGEILVGGSDFTSPLGLCARGANRHPSGSSGP